MCGERKKALIYLNQSVDIAHTIGDKKLEVKAICESGHILEEQNELEKAMMCFRKCLDILKKVKNPHETATVYGNLAVTYQHMGDFNKGIEYNRKQLTIAQNLHDINLIGHGCANLSYCYAKINNFKKAMEYVNKAEEVALKIDSENIMFIVYKTYALICKHEERWDESFSYFNKSIEIVDNLNALYYLSDVHFELGLLYEERGDSKNAKKHFNIAQEFNSRLDLKRAIHTMEKPSNSV